MRKVLREHQNGFLFTQAILTIVGLFMTTYTFLLGGMSQSTIISICLYLLLVIYSCWGYKVPHGNFLKVIGLFLTCAIIYTGLSVVSPIEIQIVELHNFQFINSILTYLFLVAAIIVVYVSGRLDKHRTNAALLVIAIIMLIISISYYQGVITEVLNAREATQQIQFAVHLSSFNPAILVATFSIAYLTRYESHIHAGLEKDKEKYKK